MKIIALFRVNLRRARLGAGFTQQGLAERTELSYKYYQDLEAGRLSGITLTTVERLASALNIEAWKLFHPSIIPEAAVKKVRGPRILR